MRWVEMIQRWLVGKQPTDHDPLAELAAEQRRLAQELGEIKGELDENRRALIAAQLRREEESWHGH